MILISSGGGIAMPCYYSARPEWKWDSSEYWVVSLAAATTAKVNGETYCDRVQDLLHDSDGVLGRGRQLASSHKPQKPGRRITNINNGLQNIEK